MVKNKNTQKGKKKRNIIKKRKNIQKNKIKRNYKKREEKKRNRNEEGLNYTVAPRKRAPVLRI